MYEVQHVHSGQLSLEISFQVSSFIRIVWTADQKGEDRFWQLSDPDGTLEHFYIAERGVLISYGAVSRLTITHMGETYNVRGVGGVFTYPAFRNEGHAGQVVAAVSEHIRASDADLGLLFSEEALHPFYGRYGWIPLTNAGVYYGDPHQPKFNDTHVMLLPVSEKSIAHRDDFEHGSLYVGASTW